MVMATFQPAASLRSRTFIGLLIAQFLAAFNDQAIHASSMFFAINHNAMSEASAISLMPILFYAPWALFCTLAGFLADRYSKWYSLVFWKVAEVGITLIALLGFWLGCHGQPIGPYVVLSTVFLMGTHSAFFVPAKYGAMPEILQPQMLSRGNGVLESLSFLAVILGTVVGGVLSQAFRGQEYWIGVLLTGLALVGALASLLIRRMPAANPGRPFPRYLYQPLWENIRTLLRSRPLAVAVIGIAFFTFIVAFMRSTMYMHGQSRVPRWDEAKTSEVVGMVALGIGLGSPLVGYLSGGKVELGLVPIGALGMIGATLVAALTLDHLDGLLVCITLIGFFTGFYIVPLFTLLQHRAPKTSKGDAVATSNFINVTGAIISSALFWTLVFAAQHTSLAPRVEQRERLAGVLTEDPQYRHGRPVRFEIQPDSGGPPQVIEAHDRGSHPRELEVEGDELIDALSQEGLKKGDQVIDSTYVLHGVKYHRLRRADQPPRPVYDNSGLPSLLFVGAALMTLGTLLLLVWRLPDLFLRTLVWLRLQRRSRLIVFGFNHLPGNGPAVLATNAADAVECLQVLSATDRTVRFVLVEERAPLGPLLALAAHTNLARLRAGSTDSADWHKMARQAEKVLAHKGVVGLPLGSAEAGEEMARLFQAVSIARPAPVLPVYYEAAPPPPSGRRRRVFILAGPTLPAGTPLETVRREIERLGEEFQQRIRDGEPMPPALSAVH
jgi:MFS family permease